MKVSILGSGAWATALAHVFAINGHDIVLIGRNQNNFDVERNINIKYFPDIVLSRKISFTTDLKEGMRCSDVILFCLPSDSFRKKAQEVAIVLDHDVVIVNATKGLDSTSFKPLSTVLEEELPKNYVKGIVSLLGPSFAEEVIQNKVTAICAVSKNEEKAKLIQNAFSNSTLRIYTNDDEIGCQIGAALKNVIAIASGAIAG